MTRGKSPLEWLCADSRVRAAACGSAHSQAGL